MEMSLLQKIQSVQSAVSVVALLVGGLWAYNEFIRERPDRARAQIEIVSMRRLELSSEKLLIRTDVRISNSGRVKIKIGDVIYKIEQVLPTCDRERVVSRGCYRDPMLDANVYAIDRSAYRINWPDIAVFKGKVGEKKVVLEPGEGQLFDFEFIVPADVQAVRIYAYVKNHASCSEPEDSKRTQTFFTDESKRKHSTGGGLEAGSASRADTAAEVHVPQAAAPSDCLGWTASALYDIRGPAASLPATT